jgi:hypothetical protein
MIELQGAKQTTQILSVNLAEVVHVECKPHPGLREALMRTGTVRVGDGGPDLLMVLEPQATVVRGTRTYVGLCATERSPERPGEVVVDGYGMAFNSGKRRTVPEAWLAWQKIYAFRPQSP